MTEESEVMRRIEERLTRLEANLAQRPAAGGFTAPGGAVVDPAPWGGAWGIPPRWTIPTPTPVVDPAPWGGWNIPPRWTIPTPTPVVDPAPWGGGFGGPGGFIPRPGPIGDPPPFDISRLTATQLEASLHTINAEKARLDAMETMIKQQMEKLKQQG